jgi:UDP-N-acetylmuramate dehydrogenase
MTTVRKLLEKINIGPEEADFKLNEPMALHTTFKVGGPADLWVRPKGPHAEELVLRVRSACRQEGIPFFVLGGGANIVVADKGIRGVVLDTSGMNEVEIRSDEEYPLLWARAGISIEELMNISLKRSLGGLEFLSGMPGSLGGALWMNARCYGSSISDVLLCADVLNERDERITIPYSESAFGYKRSPFQEPGLFILSALIKMHHDSPDRLQAKMAELRADREQRGHYRLPCAGSAFKNNYDYGKPSGQVLDELGLRGMRIGGAQLANWHGNIIVNTGNALASDIKKLAEALKAAAMRELGLELDCEILFVGDWS